VQGGHTPKADDSARYVAVYNAEIMQHAVDTWAVILHNYTVLLLVKTASIVSGKRDTEESEPSSELLNMIQTLV